MASNSFRRIALAQGLLREPPAAPPGRDEAAEPRRAEPKREAEAERTAQA